MAVLEDLMHLLADQQGPHGGLPAPGHPAQPGPLPREAEAETHRLAGGAVRELGTLSDPHTVSQLVLLGEEAAGT